jgi:hypothetical protein
LATVVVCSCSSGQLGDDASLQPDLASVDASPSEAATGDTWSNFAAGFFQTYCVTCHSPTGSDATGGKDFTQFASVGANAPVIRCGVSVAQDPSWMCASFPPPKQFPIGTGPHPTDNERNRLVSWITAGLPQ